MKTYISTLLVVLLLTATQMANAFEQASATAESEMLSLMIEKGRAQYKAGNYDDAIMVFDAILAIDQYNVDAVVYRKRAAARMAIEETIRKSASRAQAIAEIGAAWNPEPRFYGAVAESEDTVVDSSEQKAIEQMVARLKSITIPSLDFADARIEDVAFVLSEAGRRLGTTGEDVDFAILGMDSAPEEIPVSLSVADMNLYEILLFLEEMTSLKFEVGSNVVSIMPANYVPISQLVTKSYDIIPEVGFDLVSAAGSGGGLEDLFGDSSSGEAATGPVDVSGFFSIVDFPGGASAIYQPRFHKLFVKNSSKNLRAVESVLADLAEEAIKRRSEQVRIKTKFVEFSEGALEELGFDWNVYGSGTVASMGLDERGVTVGAGANSTTIDPITGQPIYADNNGRPGQNVFGSAQRNNTTGLDTVTSGLLGLMGGTPATMMLNNGDIDLQISAMEQEGTADVMSAPEVTTKSGSEALIRVAETHRYPQDWTVETGQRTSPVLRPQDWEDFDMGVSLRVTPVVHAESNTIDLELEPEMMGFIDYDFYTLGFVAYDVGSNNNAVYGGPGDPLISRMPFFDRRSIETQVTIADGHTVVMGGLVNECTETFRDQVPFLGDIPYLGRLFRTEGSRSAKKNLTIFVKVSMVDGHGMTRTDRELARQTAAN